MKSLGDPMTLALKNALLPLHMSSSNQHVGSLCCVSAPVHCRTSQLLLPFDSLASLYAHSHSTTERLRLLSDTMRRCLNYLLLYFHRCKQYITYPRFKQVSCSHFFLFTKWRKFFCHLCGATFYVPVDQHIV